jgi:Tol biopolymer transport system component
VIVPRVSPVSFVTRRLGGVVAVAWALLATACDARHVLLGDGRGREQTGNGDAGAGDPTPLRGVVPEDAGKTSDDDPSLTADLTLMLFDSKRSGGDGKEDIWETRRSSTTAEWDEPRRASVLDTASRETGIALTEDGLTVYFSSDREESSGGLDVFVATRSSVDAEWTAPERVPELCTDGDDLVSAVDPTSGALLMAHREDDGDDYDVWIAARSSAGFDAPTPVTEVNTDGEESDAFLVEDGKVLVFTRDEDLVMATRESPTSEFGAPVPVPGLNSDDDDRDVWATPDFRYVVFASDRSGSYRLYEARR